MNGLEMWVKRISYSVLTIEKNSNDAAASVNCQKTPEQLRKMSLFDENFHPS